MDFLLLVLLMVAVAAGWFLGRLQRTRQATAYPSVDVLLAQHQVESMDSLVDVLQSQESIELQLGLGTYFRKNGELEKAISIHQGLFARPDLDKQQSDHVQLALATDYLKAGLYDRAERLLQELCAGSGKLRRQASKQLALIYEEEQEWQKLLEIGQAGGLEHDLHGARQLANAACELALLAQARHDVVEARRYLRMAYKWYPASLRTRLQEIQLAEAQGDYKSVLELSQATMEDAPAFVDWVFPHLQRAASVQHKDYLPVNALRQTWQKHPIPITLHAYGRGLAQDKGAGTAAEFISQNILAAPTMEGFAQLLEYVIAQNRTLDVNDLKYLKHILDELRGHDQAYQCDHCGYYSKQHVWRCPSCKQWETLTPLLAHARLTKK
ncbi:MAG: hypothetical protein H7A08_04680 [Oceanospirillaceae bacterium]|nr:hypothetical protein [Oceanospirillaceae bacterium]